MFRNWSQNASRIKLDIISALCLTANFLAFAAGGQDLRHLVAATLERFGRLDILVNNAGIDCEVPVVDLDIDLLDRCLVVNVRAPLLLCKFALPSMLAQRSGAIFCITSGAARAYRPGRVGYSMSKAALERMFLSLAEEVKRRVDSMG